jgi:cell division protein FtsI/penicillin-binding protein 2
MNPRTGRVYAIVNQQWALREGFKPCSTIKLVTGLAGLNEKVIDPSNTTAISDSNRVNLTRALAYSKNEYFQQVGGQVGFSKMISYARLMGLGEKTGINVRNESAGRVPVSKTGFAVNHMSSHGDDFKVTALQLATLVSTIANGGKLVTPFVARTEQDLKRSTAKVRRMIDIDSESFQQMIPGMIGSVSYGSGRRAFDPQATVAGKTGTCIEHGTWVGLFTSYAPLNDPQLAVAVIARGSDGRNHFPAAVAGRIYRDLNSRLGMSRNIDIASRRPAISTTSATDAEVDTDEEEADAEEFANDSSSKQLDSNKPVWGDQRKAAESKVKRTVMTLPSRTTQTSNDNWPTQRARRAGARQ